MYKENDSSASNSVNMATVGGGCFWCVEAVYDEIGGVEQVVSGYAGGTVDNPSYEQVCAGTTGYVEVVQITFESKVVSYDDLLKVFFTVHDPTTFDRQGADIGSQYRSVIFYHDGQQKLAAEQAIRKISDSKMWENPIVTVVAPLTNFYMAEAYHQNYYMRNPYQSYCQAVIAPKMSNFRKRHLEKLKK